MANVVLLNSIAKKYDANITLKEQQIACLSELLREKPRDIIVNLPVGYGKSLIFHLLPALMRFKLKANKCTVLVIAPLNIIQKDHTNILREHNIPCCRLDIKGQIVQSDDKNHDDVEDDEADDFVYQCHSDVTLQDVKLGNVDIVYAHPEALLNTKLGQDLLNDANFQDVVKAGVVDEWHVIEEW